LQEIVTDPRNVRTDRGTRPAEQGNTLIRVYEYGCWHEAIRGLDIAIEQMFRRNELWNQIVKIDNDVRTKMDAALFAGAQEEKLGSIREKLKELRSRLATLRADPKSSKAERDQVRAQVKAAVLEVRTALDEVKRARKANAEENRAFMRELDADRLRRIRQAQVHTGLYWCSRTEVLRNYEVARRRAMKEGRRLKPKPWNGTGTVCVYFQKGLKVSGVFGNNGRLQIDPVPKDAWKSPSRSVRRRLTRTRLRMRVAANADLSPVWLELPMTMHRPLPDGGVIRWASIVREQVGLSFRHRLLLTVREPAPTGIELPFEAVGVDVGWRVTADGLRVAYWYGADGNHGALVLPHSDLSAFRQIDSLQSTITAAHDQTRSFLKHYLDRQAVPQTLGELAAAAVSSPSQRVLVKMFEHWKTNRFLGDENAFATISAWHKQHVHLWTWQSNLRDQLIRRRRELYRCFAAELARRFRCVFLNDVQLRRMSARPPAVRTAIPAQRQHRFIAAISVLSRIVQHAFEKQGGTVTLMKTEHATMSCHACGVLDEWNPASTLAHTCSNCGLSWDQDYNAARNVLRQGLALKPISQMLF
jgi:hypothetical protein